MPWSRLVCRRFLRESSRGHHLWKSQEGSRIGQRRNRAVMHFQWHQPAHEEPGVALQSCPESRQEDQAFTLPSIYRLLDGSYPTEGAYSLGKMTLQWRHFLKKTGSPRRSGGPLYPLEIEFLFTSPISRLPFVLGQPSWIEGYILYIVEESLWFTMPELALDMLNGSYKNLENCFFLKNVWLLTNDLVRKCYFQFKKLTYNPSFFFVAFL